MGEAGAGAASASSRKSSLNGEDKESGRASGAAAAGLSAAGALASSSSSSLSREEEMLAYKKQTALASLDAQHTAFISVFASRLRDTQLLKGVWTGSSAGVAAGASQLSSYLAVLRSAQAVSQLGTSVDLLRSIAACSGQVAASAEELLPDVRLEGLVAKAAGASGSTASSKLLQLTAGLPSWQWPLTTLPCLDAVGCLAPLLDKLLQGSRYEDQLCPALTVAGRAIEAVAPLLEASAACCPVDLLEPGFAQLLLAREWEARASRGGGAAAGAAGAALSKHQQASLLVLQAALHCLHGNGVLSREKALLGVSSAGLSSPSGRGPYDSGRSSWLTDGGGTAEEEGKEEGEEHAAASSDSKDAALPPAAQWAAAYRQLFAGTGAVAAAGAGKEAAAGLHGTLGYHAAAELALVDLAIEQASGLSAMTGGPAPAAALQRLQAACLSAGLPAAAWEALSPLYPASMRGREAAASAVAAGGAGAGAEEVALQRLRWGRLRLHYTGQQAAKALPLLRSFGPGLQRCRDYPGRVGKMGLKGCESLQAALASGEAPAGSGLGLAGGHLPALHSAAVTAEDLKHQVLQKEKRSWLK